MSYVGLDSVRAMDASRGSGRHSVARATSGYEAAAIAAVRGVCRDDRLRAGAGTPLVLLHGLGGSWRAWLPVIEALCARYDVLALTLPGHVGSAPLARGLAVSAAALAEDLVARLDEERVTQAHIVGNSLGGALAFELARRSRALTVTVIAPVGLLMGDEAARLAQRLRRSRGLARAIRPAALGMAGSRIGRRLLFGQIMDRPALLPRVQARGWLEDFIQCPAFDDILAGLSATQPDAAPPSDLGCPVSIIWPERDRMMPAVPFAERFRTALPQATHVRLPAAGHIPMWDAPDQVAALIMRYARSPGAGTEVAAP
jgi:pimeloyl-ACP methyl ester carboxylesterase